MQTKEHPVDVNPEIADGFKNLRTDIQGFTKDFQRYFIDKKQELEKEAIRLQGVIEKLLGEIETYVLMLGFHSTSRRMILLAGLMGR